MSSTSSDRQAKVSRSLFLAALALVLLAVGGTLGQRHFFHSDETRFALLARDVLSGGSWLIPNLQGEPYMNKPPLFIWFISLVSLPGGRVTEWTARLPSALAAVGGAAATALIGARLWNARVGLLAAAILGTSVGYVHHAGLALPDMTLTCLMVFALFAFYSGLLDGRRSAIAVGYGLVGLAVLSKGPVGFLVLAPIAAAAFDQDRRRWWRNLCPLVGVGILTALLLPFVLIYLARDADLYLSVWQKDYWQWASRVTGRSAPPWFPLGSLVTWMLPWSLLFPLLLHGAGPRLRDDQPRRWILYWFGLMLATFLLVVQKRDRYLLPLYPAVALLLAERIERLQTAVAPAWSRVAAITWLAGTGIAAVVFLGLVRPGDPLEAPVFFPESTAGQLLASATAIMGGLAVGLLLWRHRVPAAAVAVTLTAAVLSAVVWAGYPSRYNTTHDISGFAKRARATLRPSDEQLSYQYGKPALEFYLEHPVWEVADAGALERRMTGPGRVLCVLEESRLPAQAHWPVLIRQVIAGRSILLVANRLE